MTTPENDFFETAITTIEKYDQYKEIEFKVFAWYNGLIDHWGSLDAMPADVLPTIQRRFSMLGACVEKMKAKKIILNSI